MKKEDLFEIIEDIDEEYINEARMVRPVKTKPDKVKKLVPALIKWMSAAACICLIFWGVMALRKNHIGPHTTPTPQNPEEHQYYATPTEGEHRIPDCTPTAAIEPTPTPEASSTPTPEPTPTPTREVTHKRCKDTIVLYLTRKPGHDYFCF